MALSSLAFAACGGDDDDTSSSVPATVAASPATPTTAGAASSEFNGADVEFAQRMIAHHEQAIEMAEIALDPARQANVDVTALAGRVQAAQDPEIVLMSGWLDSWGQSAQMDTSEGHDMSDMSGMMSAEDMDELATMTSSKFDDMWLTMMVEHHEGAIEMATKIQDAGRDANVKDLATQIVATQEAEVDEMNGLLDG